MVYEQYEKVIDELYRKENLRLKARKDANLTEEVKVEIEREAQTVENWDANSDLEGGYTGEDCWSGLFCRRREERYRSYA